MFFSYLCHRRWHMFRIINPFAIFVISTLYPFISKCSAMWCLLLVSLFGPCRNTHQTLLTFSSVTDDCLSQTFISAQAPVQCLPEVMALNSHPWLASMKSWNTVFCVSFPNFAPSGLITIQFWSLNAVLYVCKLTLNLKVAPLVPGIKSSRLLFDCVGMQFLWCCETTWPLYVVVVASDCVTVITAIRAFLVQYYRKCIVSHALWWRFFGSSSWWHAAECCVLKIGKLTFLS